MYAALFAKFSQNPELKPVLLLTYDAELWHGAPRVSPARQYLLELVRAEMKAALIPFGVAAEKLVNGEIVDSRLQPSTGKNTLITLIAKDGTMYLVNARYDQATGQIFPPI